MTTSVVIFTLVAVSIITSVMLSGVDVTQCTLVPGSSLWDLVSLSCPF